jgi:hypothetical protein
MPIGAQPPGRRGTVGHPYSALRLRLILAVVGLVTCVILAALMMAVDLEQFGWVLVALAAVAVVDIVVVARRIRAGRRAR